MTLGGKAKDVDGERAQSFREAQRITHCSSDARAGQVVLDRLHIAMRAIVSSEGNTRPRLTAKLSSTPNTCR